MQTFFLKKLFSPKVVRHCLNIALVLFFIAYAGEELDIPAIARMDNIAYDLRLKAMMPNTKDPRIVIVDIDENSLMQVGRWPWPRNTMAKLVDQLFKHYQIDLLAFDVMFSEPDTSSGLGILTRLAQQELREDTHFQQAFKNLQPELAYDAQFAASLQDKPVVLSFFFNPYPEAINPNNALPPPLPATNPTAFDNLILKAVSYGANLRSLQQATGVGGFFNNLAVDDDGVYRRIPLIAEYQQQFYEALSLAIYRKYLEIKQVEFVVPEPGAPLEGIRLFDYVIPTDQHGRIFVPYRGDHRRSFTYVSAVDVLEGRADAKLLEHKLVIVGTTAAGLMDMRSTPIQNIFPGVEIHANIVSGLLDRHIKFKPDYMTAFEILELLVIGVLGVYLFAKLSPLYGALAFLILVALIILNNLVLWTTLDVDSILVTPLLLVVSLFIVQTTFNYLLVTLNQQILARNFGQYVPTEIVKQMVEQVVESREEFSLAGESREMTVLFSDVRGFTTLSEGLEPQQLTRLMNDILSPITEVIHHQRGTIDKYMGDAVMAFWGAPLADAEHAHHAVTAALEIPDALERVNQDFKARGWPQIKIGIGLNSGKMSVGNMGSSFRMAYTVLGDAVNLGSRLEGLTKQYGVTLIVSEFTKSLAPQFAYRELDKVRVKGKNEPITIFEPLCVLAALTPQMQQELDVLAQALHDYRQQAWQDAAFCFQRLAQTSQRAFLYQLYLERIAHFEQYPPEADWDGVFTHTSK